MTRLVLRTGRFRDMGYETLFSGLDPTSETRVHAERLFSSLRKGSPKGGSGIVVRVNAAGRGAEEILAVMLPRPLLQQSEARVIAELQTLHRDDLSPLLDAAARASSIHEARTILRRGLEQWMRRLEPLLAFAPEQGAETTKASPTLPGKRWTGLGLALMTTAIVGTAVIIWLGSSGPEKAVSSNSATDPDSDNHAEGAESPEAQDMQSNRAEALATDLDPADASLRSRFAEGRMTDDQVIQKRRAIAGVFLDLRAIKDARGLEVVEHAASDLSKISGSTVLASLVEIRGLQLPESTALCTTDAACPPHFNEADEQVLQALGDAYGIIWKSFLYTEDNQQPDPLKSRSDAVGFGERMVLSGFRPKEINLRGELHRAGLGSDAAALLDPLIKLVDCPTPSVCTLPAALAVAPDE